MARTSKSFEPHPFVAAMTKNGERPPRVKAIRGYVGQSADRKSVRIFLDLELRHFVDVPLEGIVHSERISESAVPLGGIFVWVREDTPILHHGAWALPEDPSTMATGEEGGPPTTMATGEETSGFVNPLDLVANPLGQF